MQQLRSLFATLIVVLSAVAAAAQQQEVVRTFTPPATGLIARWDDLNQRMLYHRVNLKPSTIGIYAVDAQDRQTLAIDVLKDFPGALRGAVSVDNVAGGPDGSVVLFCILVYGGRNNLKEMVLTYSSSGVLKTAFDAAPHEAGALTTDEQGNIYLFASQFGYDAGDTKAVYDTVVKYNSAGHIVKTMLPSSNFPAGDYPTGYSDQNGGPLLRVTSKGIAVFGALSGRWFLMSQEGGIIARSDLSSTIRKVVDQYHSRRAWQGRDFLDSDGWPVFHLRLDDGPFNAGNVPPPDQMRFQEPLVKIDPTTSAFAEIVKDVHGRDGMKIPVGIDNHGNLVYSQVKLDTAASTLSSASPQ
jgi:hypothetical protein